MPIRSGLTTGGGRGRRAIPRGGGAPRAGGEGGTSSREGRARARRGARRAPPPPRAPGEPPARARRRGERVGEAREPRGLRHLRVVVEEAEELGIGEPPGTVERRDHAGVGRAPREGVRVWVGKALEELRGTVGGAVVHDDQVKWLGR